MARFNRLDFSEVMEKDFSTIVDAYSSFSTATAEAASIFLIQNLTDKSVMISFDGGVTDHLPVVSDSYLLLDLNIKIKDANMMLGKSTEIAVRRLTAGDAPTTGSVWISVLYARNG